MNSGVLLTPQGLRMLGRLVRAESKTELPGAQVKIPLTASSSCPLSFLSLSCR
jgi:hypothetical protein